MTTRTGFDGYVCATTGNANSSAKTVTAAKLLKCTIKILLALLSSPSGPLSAKAAGDSMSATIRGIAAKIAYRALLPVAHSIKYQEKTSCRFRSKE